MNRTPQLTQVQIQAKKEALKSNTVAILDRFTRKRNQEVIRTRVYNALSTLPNSNSHNDMVCVYGTKPDAFWTFLINEIEIDRISAEDVYPLIHGFDK